MPFTNHSVQEPSPLRKSNAAFIILARNSDLPGLARSVRELEDRFNHRYQYPYVFLNDEPFDEKFKKHISILTDAKVEFGQISHDHWSQPDWIDEDVAKSWREWMVLGDIIYGGSVSYRNMCRFNSGFFFHHPLVQKYRWYWRVEPDVHFHCNIDFDPFLYMEDNQKVYGFTISMYEYESTIMTLWNHVQGTYTDYQYLPRLSLEQILYSEFANLHPEYMAPNNSLEFISEDGGETYNLCHFWSNFEIADLDFWRGNIYQEFFEFLDQQGGFYYERWGDAPVHSIAAALFLNRTQLHFFDEIGYEHPPYTHCPKKGNNWAKGRCTCDPDPEANFDDSPGSCLGRWESLVNGTLV
ncbi:glycosyl transferase [Coprinopsis marcescibilis]|uniref:Glycosyl transferase n=1 Tax=Coprinopsis marcescibilis TaxID=230819 RepID=A0A5C3KQ60_COPMA|nr:glycosyl transferase [Coprinopsis marcescibilis]